MNYKINKYGELETEINKTEDVQEVLFQNVSLMWEMNKKFFSSQDEESLKVVIVAIMKSI